MVSISEHPARPDKASLRRAALLACAGAVLATTQFLVLRELVSALYGEEVVLLLVNLCMFAAMSLGYGASMRLSPRAQRLAFVAVLPLHLALPVLPRHAFAWLASAGLGAGWPLALALALALLLLAPTCTVLPRVVEQGDDPVRAMRVGYSFELLGFVLGLGLVQLALGHDIAVLVGIHWALLAALTGLGLGDLRAGLAALVVAGALWPSVPARSRRAGEHLYRALHGMPLASLQFSRDSAYQRVEVVDDGPGRRSLYLDGLENLNASDLALLNDYLGLLPARVLHPARTLLIGNGTLSMVPPLARSSGELVSVELDPVVVEAGKALFSPAIGRRDLHNWRAIEGDGKHVLAQLPGHFDLIIVDVPSPLTFQEAFLHTREFYALVREHLTPQGVVTVQLSGDAIETGAERSPVRITAALQAELGQVMVVESRSAERAFAYASMALPFGAEAVRAAAPPAERGLTVRTPEEVAERVKGARPLDLDSLDLVLRRGMQRLWGRHTP